MLRRCYAQIRDCVKKRRTPVVRADQRSAAPRGFDFCGSRKACRRPAAAWAVHSSTPALPDAALSDQPHAFSLHWICQERENLLAKILRIVGARVQRGVLGGKASLG